MKAHLLRRLHLMNEHSLLTIHHSMKAHSLPPTHHSMNEQRRNPQSPSRDESGSRSQSYSSCTSPSTADPLQSTDNRKATLCHTASDNDRNVLLFRFPIQILKAGNRFVANGTRVDDPDSERATILLTKRLPCLCPARSNSPRLAGCLPCTLRRTCCGNTRMI